MKVYKFGGASVKSAEGVRNLVNIVSGEEELFIIVSAMGKRRTDWRRNEDCADGIPSTVSGK